VRGGDGMQYANEIRFDEWTLRRDSGEIARDGRAVRLRAQSQYVLETLLERPGEVVARERLIAELWPKGIVDFDTALNSIVRRLRSALEDDAGTPRYIETLPRRGYRYIGTPPERAPVATAAPAVPETTRAASPGRRWRVAAMAFVATLALAGGAAMRTSPDRPLAHAHRPGSHESGNPQALEEYRLGRYFLERRSEGDLGRARTHFDATIALDPDFAQAHAGLASAYWLLSVEGIVQDGYGMAHMRASAERALALDPDLAEPHVRLASYALLGGDPRRADEHVRQARIVDPASALVLGNASTEALVEGRIEEGVDLARRAAAAEPLSPIYRYNLAGALLVAGRWEEAKAVNLELLDADPRSSTEIAGQVLVLQGAFEEALALASAWPNGAEKQEIEALAYYGQHRGPEADAALASLIATVRDSDPLRIVEVYAYRGEPERAFDWLSAATAWLKRGNLPHPSPCLVPWVLRLSPFVASLHDDARWRDWVKATAQP